MNVDSKILSKVLAGRCRKVLASIVHPDQTCAVPGRKIWDSLTIIRDTLWLAKDRGNPLAILALDFQKAFDSLSHEYLFKVLRKMGFPEGFIKTIGLIYTGCESQVLINGTLSEGFHIESGVRQGCPLSPALFVCAIEPLLCAIRKDKCITGPLVPGSQGKQVKCVAYMDDVTIACTDARSIKRTFLITQLFFLAAGLQVNVEKTHCMTVGQWDKLSQLPVKPSKDPVKILGILFSQAM